MCMTHYKQMYIAHVRTLLVGRARVKTIVKCIQQATYITKSHRLTNKACSLRDGTKLCS